jgi:hypothetical protein
MIPMKASFWKALEALGASGSALCDWKHHLDDDWDACARFLKPTGRTAFSVIDPRQPKRRLTVGVDGDEDFVGYGEDEPSLPPVPFSAGDVAEFSPQWNPIAQALAPAVPFDHGAWETEGQMRRIGSLQDKFGHVRPVLLFLPGGHLGDYTVLLRSLSARTDSTVLFPSGRWLTADIENLRERNGLSFVNIAERLAQFEADPASRVPLPAAGGRPSGSGPAVRALIHAGNDLTWNQVRIEVNGSKMILLKAPGQEREFHFPPNVQVTADHALGMLMRLAADGEWRNPPLGSLEYERVSRAFRRLRQLLQALVPLPGDPFSKLHGAFIPLFQIRLHPGLEAEICRRTPR